MFGPFSAVICVSNVSTHCLLKAAWSQAISNQRNRDHAEAEQIFILRATNIVGTPTAQLERYVEKHVRQFGDTVMSQLRDPLTEDIVLNPDGKLWVKTLGESFKTFGTSPHFSRVLVKK